MTDLERNETVLSVRLGHDCSTLTCIMAIKYRKIIIITIMRFISYLHFDGSFIAIEIVTNEINAEGGSVC